MKVKSESEGAQSCLTLSGPMDCSLPGSSVHAIFQARVLELLTTITILQNSTMTIYLLVPKGSTLHFCVFMILSSILLFPLKELPLAILVKQVGW